MGTSLGPDSHPVRLIDTCGIYKGWRTQPAPGQAVDEKLREPGWGTMRAMHTSGVCVVVIDAERSRRELVLIKMATDHGKAVVLAVNKWDLIPEDRAADVRARILKRVEHGMSQVKGLP